MNKKPKKIRWIIITSLIVALVALTGVFTYLTIGTKTKEAVVKPTIALVNEDTASNFNKKDYNFGKDFVSLVSGDSKYNWQVVSRSVADRAYADKSVDAVIYIPQAFSHDILTLQDISPIKSQVNYKLQSNESALSQNVLNDKITSVLKDFNQNIVKMYYASVAGNISEAQNNMNDVITNQDNVLSTLSHQVYGPFQSTNQNYSSVISSANGLKSENSAWISSQNSFTKSTQSMLDSTSKTFTGQLTGLQQYFNTQKQITDVNLKNGNQGITNQSEDDQKVYFKQFDDSHTSTLNNLFNFYKKDETTESGVLTNLQNQVKDYNTVITGVHDDINNQIESLTTNRDHLIDLENKLYTQFFAKTSPGLNNSNFDDEQIADDYQKDDNAREALAQKLGSSFGQTDSFGSTDYMNKLNYSLSKIAWTSQDYSALFTAMQKNGITTAKYENELDLINRYGSVIPNLSPGQTKFGDAPAVDTDEQSFTQKLTIKVPKGESYRLKTNSPANVQVNYDDQSSNATNDGQIKGDGTSGLVLYNKNHEKTNSDGSVTNEPNDSDSTFTIYYNVLLNKISNTTVEFSWGVNGNENNISATYTLFPANEISEYLGGNKFGEISDLLSQIDDTANLITWIYGKPSYDLSDMLRNLPNPASLADFKILSKESIYYLYGNIDIAKRKDKLSDEDVQKYKESGHNNIDDLIKSIQDLNASIDVLTKNRDILAKNLPNDVFNQKIKDLEDWYSTTMTSINQQYDSWKKNGNQSLALKSWKEYDSDDTALYQDTAASDDLYKTISDLSTSTAKSADETSKSAQLIKGNGNEFTQMVTTTQETKTSAEKLLKNTDNLLNTGNTSLKDSKDYNKNFGKVLANTHSQEADKNQLFDFFAQPLSIKNLTSAFTSVKKGFDWRWPLLLIIGVMIGILGTMISRMISNRKQTNINN
ncbi:type VII secretion protein EsaA [Lactococcus lactis]|uniref:type VII secretion protein EsaA n=1 Tax=Lactococcus lactis TaxID=1358 RepID=UPI0021AEB4E0|nr:type VII secretion protein EsaA [Lactococcus lactis]MCT0078119.1 type VII secretion protein EsaA [Lactococcus lactis subsp. lactis]MCT0442347.1 type VII secretion protein EsaA [Lactococcus lactis subsp. lactis]MCT1180406.1 type VII secretion protein EsaA [Lactococcus lactis]